MDANGIARGSLSAAQIRYVWRARRRRLEEFEIEWLSGYENSQPVRIGNAATKQFQLDVYGEVLDSMYRAHRAGIESNETDWRLQAALINFLESKWEEPDEGIWEVRGARQQFTHPKMMAGGSMGGEVDRAGNCAAEIISNAGKKFAMRFTPSLRPGLHPRKKKAFTQFYGSEEARRELVDEAAGRILPRRTRGAQHDRAVERELMKGVSFAAIARRKMA